MASYEYWCETCQLSYVEEKPMAESDTDSFCKDCAEKSMRKYNINTIFKGSGFYSTDKKNAQKGK